MNWTRVGIVASLALCVWLAWPKGQSAAPPRPLLIKAALKDVKDPIIILGDSIVAQAPLPRSICGRPVINAGIGGSTTVSGLDTMLVRALGSKRAALIVVSVGVDDAAIPIGAENYKTNYIAMLKVLEKATSRIAITSVTSVDTDAEHDGSARNATIKNYNSVLPTIAQEARADLVIVPPLSRGHTADGIHLNADGYTIWNKAVLGGIESLICKPT